MTDHDARVRQAWGLLSQMEEWLAGEIERPKSQKAVLNTTFRSKLVRAVAEAKADLTGSIHRQEAPPPRPLSVADLVFVKRNGRLTR